MKQTADAKKLFVELEPAECAPRIDKEVTGGISEWIESNNGFDFVPQSASLEVSVKNLKGEVASTPTKRDD